MKKDHGDARKDGVGDGPTAPDSTSEVCLSCGICRRDPLHFDCLCEICPTCDGCKIEHLHKLHDIQDCECLSKNADEGSGELKPVSGADFEDEGKDGH